MEAITMRPEKMLTSAFILGLALLSSGGAVAHDGELTQLPGTDACVSEDGNGDGDGDCADGVGLAVTWSVPVSPDGRNLYAASDSSSSVAVFVRDRRTGALTQLPGTDACVSEFGGDGICADGVGLLRATSVTVSPDGRNVYVGSSFGGGTGFEGAVAVFARDRRTGALTQLPGTDACISEDGTGGDCADGVALAVTPSVAVSPDGRHVYVASGDGVAVFARDRRTGALAQLPGTDGCISGDGSGGACADGIALDGAGGVSVSPDGRNVYIASGGGAAVAVFARDRRTGALTQLPGTDACISEDGTGGDCADGVALNGAGSIVVSPDGRNVYVGTGLAVAVLARDRRTGALTQLSGTDACISGDGSGGVCADGIALDGAGGVSVSPDGRNVYVVSGDSVAVLARDRRTGALAQLPGTDGCISGDGTSGGNTGVVCADGSAVFSLKDTKVSPDGRNVYVASQASFVDWGAVLVFAREHKGHFLAAR
jgi:DNA-binding beta-propeller fold protein YncE